MIECKWQGSVLDKSKHVDQCLYKDGINEEWLKELRKNDRQDFRENLCRSV